MNSAQNNSGDTTSASPHTAPIRITDLINWVDELSRARSLISAVGHLGTCVERTSPGDEIETVAGLAKDDIVSVIHDMNDFLDMFRGDK